MRSVFLVAAILAVAVITAGPDATAQSGGIWVRGDARVVGGAASLGHESFLGSAGGAVTRVIQTSGGDAPGLAVFDVAWDAPPAVMTPGQDATVRLATLNVTSVNYVGSVTARLSARAELDTSSLTWVGAFPHVDYSCTAGTCMVDSAGAVTSGSVNLSISSGSSDGQVKTFRWTVHNCGAACDIEWDYTWDADGAGEPDPNSSLRCDGRRVTIGPDDRDSFGNLIGTFRDDVIYGTDEPDFIDGKGGNDTICGRGGDDIIKGGDGRDRIFGGRGDDTIRGGKKRDRILGGEGRDLIYGNSGRDTLKGGPDRDYIFGGRGRDLILGQGGRDLLIGSGDPGRKGRRWFRRGASEREGLNAKDGADTINGGEGRDSLYGGRGDDVLNGGGSIDILRGNRGDDTLRGGSGDDLLYGGKNRDSCDTTGWAVRRSCEIGLR